MQGSTSPATEQILGIRFFNGTPAEAVDRMSVGGGLLVAPSGTCFHRLLKDETYRGAVATADVALPDSGLMVLLWRLLKRRSVKRISGFAYIKELVRRADLMNPGAAIWVLPHERARDQLLRWAREHGIAADSASCYIAPFYGRIVEDPVLLELVNERQPAHVVVGIGAGPQEKLGRYLREHAAHRPAIHCIGGALGFVTGDQVAIPNWADRLYLGWFFRLVTQPRVFIPRLTKARVLPLLIARYGSELPPLKEL